MLSKLIDFITFHPKALRICFLILVGIYMMVFLRKRQKARMMAMETETFTEPEALFKIRELLRILKQADKMYVPARLKPALAEDQDPREQKQRELAHRKALRQAFDMKAVDPRTYTTAKIHSRSRRVTKARETLIYSNLLLDQVNFIHFGDLLAELSQSPEAQHETFGAELQALMKSYRRLQTRLTPELTQADLLRLGCEKYAKFKKWKKHLLSLKALITEQMAAEKAARKPKKKAKKARAESA